MAIDNWRASHLSLAFFFLFHVYLPPCPTWLITIKLQVPAHFKDRCDKTGRQGDKRHLSGRQEIQQERLGKKVRRVCKRTTWQKTQKGRLESWCLVQEGRRTPWKFATGSLWPVLGLRITYQKKVRMDWREEKEIPMIISPWKAEHLRVMWHFRRNLNFLLSLATRTLLGSSLLPNLVSLSLHSSNTSIFLVH